MKLTGSLLRLYVIQPCEGTQGTPFFEGNRWNHILPGIQVQFVGLAWTRHQDHVLSVVPNRFRVLFRLWFCHRCAGRCRFLYSTEQLEELHLEYLLMHVSVLLCNMLNLELKAHERKKTLPRALCSKNEL